MTSLDLSQTFQSTDALAGMFLWLLFGLLSSLINCDLQRILRKSRLALHLTSLVAFFFLFTVIDSGNNASLLATWVKTLFVYALFLLSTKSKWYFAVPVLALLLVDQSVGKHMAYISARAEAAGQDGAEAAAAAAATRSRVAALKKGRRVLNAVIFALILAGAAHYMALQRAEYGPRFSLAKFFLGSGKPCKSSMPDYSASAAARPRAA